MKKKKILCMAMCALMVASAVPAFADGDSAAASTESSAVSATTEAQTDKVTVNMNGTDMEFDVEPIIENGRTLVPFRAIFEALDCAVSYKVINGQQYVQAERGSDVVLLTIGDTEMFAGGESITLDVAPKIVNSRTLVPLRAVSESLGCKVEWYNESRTVRITKEVGQTPITSGHLEKTIRDKDGADLIYITACYPIISEENAQNASFVKELNKQYKEKAENYMTNVESANTADAAELRVNMGEYFTPLEFCLSFDVTTNRKDLLSITVHNYQNAGGAHPSTLLESRNFQMDLCKELKLTDAFGMEQAELNKMFVKDFTAEMKSTDSFSDDTTERLTAEAANASWYITDDAVVVYFQTYQVGPYVIGMPGVRYEYKDGKTTGTPVLDLSDANLDSYTLELEGNPTTGYEWEVIEDEADKVKVTKEYVAAETAKDIVGAGGTYKFKLQGISQGNAELEFGYFRSFDASAPIEKTVILKVYVDENNKITVLDKIEK
jgi:predicted secreted protein